METKIIEQMRKELYDTHLCKQDFEKYDLKTFENTDEPFFWLVREHSTTLCRIGATMIKQYFTSETSRMEIMRDPLFIIAGITYWNDNTNKYFYWDGWKLHKIEKNDILHIFQNIWGTHIAELANKYPEEFSMKDEPLQLVMPPETANHVKEVKAIAQELHDDSFENCLKRLQNWRRKAIDHRIEIYNDFSKNSFGFTEVINGENKIYGGIIMSPKASDGRWSIHT